MEMKPVHIEHALLHKELELGDGETIDRLRAQEKEPMLLTRNGEPTAVLMSPEYFDRLITHTRFLAAVTEGLADSHAGRVMSDEELGAELEAELGLALP